MPRIEITAYIDVEDLEPGDLDESSSTGVSVEYYEHIVYALMNLGCEDVAVRPEN